MTDEARIERLTELARRVWPDARNMRNIRAGVYDFPDGLREAFVEYDPPDSDSSPILLSGSIHERSLDALEAALLVLAGETPTWIEQLASELEQRANRLEAQRVYGKAYALREVATELRERAKEARHG